MQDHINELLRQLDLALEDKDGPEEKLRAFVAFHVTYHMTKKREVFIANSELRSLEPKNYEVIVALRGAYEQRLAQILAEGVSEGVFEVVDIQVATFAILALLTGLCTWYRPGGRLTREAIVAAHEKLVLSGVRPRRRGGSGAKQAQTGPQPRGLLKPDRAEMGPHDRTPAARRDRCENPVRTAEGRTRPQQRAGKPRRYLRATLPAPRSLAAQPRRHQGDPRHPR